MKIKKIFTLCLTFLILMTLSACGNSITANEFIDLSGEVIAPEEDIRTCEVTAYYKDSYGYVVPVQTKIEWSEGIAKSVIRKMMHTAELQKDLVVMGLESLMPPEAVINGIDISNGLAKIDFATNKLTINNLRDEKCFVEGVVLALTAFPTVKEVQFMFNGHVIDALPFGTNVSKPLKAVDINATQPSSGESVVLYYSAKSPTDFTYYVPVTTYLSSNDCKSALNQLISSNISHLDTCIPQNAKVLNCQMIGNTLCIFFNEEFNSLKGSYSDEMRAMRSITLTCSQFYEFTNIKVYAGSKEYKFEHELEVFSAANVG